MKCPGILFFLLCLISFTINAQSGQKGSSKRNISGNVSQYFQHCGGDELGPDDIGSTKGSYPYKKFFIRKDTINSIKKPVILSFTTDKDGNFSFQLDPGTYMIILEEQLKKPDLKKYKNSVTEVDQKCLSAWWEKPYHILIVGKKDISGLNFNFHKRCFIDSDIPCLQYNGPMPP